MKVLVTGGAGFIGSNVSIKLHEKGYQVVVLDNLSKQIHGDNPERTSHLYNKIKEKVEFIKGSVTSREDILKAITDVDYIIHLAAETGTGQSMYDIHKYVDCNIGGTAMLLDVLTNTNHQVKRVVVAESRAIYGEGKYLCPKCGEVYPLERLDSDLKNGDFNCRCPKCGGGGGVN